MPLCKEISQNKYQTLLKYVCVFVLNNGILIILWLSGLYESANCTHHGMVSSNFTKKVMMGLKCVTLFLDSKLDSKA